MPSPSEPLGLPSEPDTPACESAERCTRGERRWPEILALTALLSVSIEMLRPLLRATVAAAERSSFVPWTFHTFWEMLALWGIIWVVRKMKVPVAVFVAVLLLGVFISSVAWSFMPQSWILLNPNYYGVQSRLTLQTHSTRVSEEYNWPLHLSYLYPADSSLWRAERQDRAYENEYVASVGFLTWQAGLASGYMPHESITEYVRSSTVQLYLTVGPVVLAESSIIGLYQHWALFLILQFMWFRYRHKHIWWS